ncbi:MAG TPA: hypothetical protein VIY72_12885, partial [Acidimicrobiales bacterium]
GAMTSPTADTVRAWAAGSVGLGATVEVVGDDVVLRSCEAEPGSPAAQPADRTELGVSYATLRSQAFAEALTSGADVDQAACFGEYIVRHITPEEMAAGAASDPATAQRLGREGSEACL